MSYNETNNTVSETSSSSEYLGDSHTTVLRVVRTLSSFLSVVGSSLIIGHVMVRARCRNSRNFSPPKNRLLVGLSMSDLIFSLENFIFTPLLYPFTEPSALCRFDGFLHSLGNAAAYYNASLSFYFMAVIRWNIRDADFGRRYEVFCHVLPVGVALTAATTAAILDLYNPKAEGLGCWIEDYPLGCTEEEDESVVLLEAPECRGDARMLRLFPTLAIVCPFLVALIVMISSNVLIFRFVRALEHRNARYSSLAMRHNQNAGLSPEASTSTHHSSRRESSSVEIMDSTTSVPQPPISNKVSSLASSTSTRRPTSSSSNSNNTAQYYKRSKKIAIQSFCYIGAFFACYLPGVLFWISGFIYPEGQTNGKMFWLQVISAIFFPAQGFFNMLIYLRPQVIAWREAVLDKGRFYAWRMAICLKNPPPPRQRPCNKNNNPLPAVGLRGITWQQNNNNYSTGNENDNSKDNNVTMEGKNSMSHHSSTMALVEEYSETNDDNPTMQGLDNAISGTSLSESFQTPSKDDKDCHDDNVSIALFWKLHETEPLPQQVQQEPQQQQEEEVPKQPLDAHNDVGGGDEEEVEEEASLTSSRRSSRSKPPLLDEGIPLQIDNLEDEAAFVTEPSPSCEKDDDDHDLMEGKISTSPNIFGSGTRRESSRSRRKDPKQINADAIVICSG
jgi:hypothetical protein